MAMTNQDLNVCAEELDIWCYKRGTETNTSKCKLLNIKGNMGTTLKNNKLETTHVQKVLGLVVTLSLTWSAKCDRLVQKATRAFYHLKRNVSPNCSWTNKLQSYTIHCSYHYVLDAGMVLQQNTLFVT